MNGIEPAAADGTTVPSMGPVAGGPGGEGGDDPLRRDHDGPVLVDLPKVGALGGVEGGDGHARPELVALGLLVRTGGVFIQIEQVPVPVGILIQHVAI